MCLKYKYNLCSSLPCSQVARDRKIFNLIKFELILNFPDKNALFENRKLIVLGYF